MNPENKPQKRTSLGKVFTWIALSFLAFIILLIMIIPDVPETAKVEENTKAEIPVEKKEIKKVADEIHPISPTKKEFRIAFNKYAEEFDLDFRMPEIENYEDSKTAFVIVFNDHITLMGQLYDDQTVKSFGLMSTNDGSYNTVADQLLAIGGMITAQNPALGAKDRGRIIKKLGLMAEDFDLQKLKKTYIENGIEYGIVYNSTDHVLMFTVYPEDK